MIIRNIWHGWKNMFFENEAAEKLAEIRIKICNVCPTRSKSGKFCTKKRGGCGCVLSAAVRSPEYKCIKGKW